MYSHRSSSRQRHESLPNRPGAATRSEQGHGEQAATTTHVALRSKTPVEICKHMQDELKGLLAMEYDSNAEPPLMPYGFGIAWDDSASGCIFPWRYGATNSCNLGLCKDMFMGKTCRDNKCTHVHNRPSYDQFTYLLSHPDARTRKAARESVHDFFRCGFMPELAWTCALSMTLGPPPPPPQAANKSSQVVASSTVKLKVDHG